MTSLTSTPGKAGTWNRATRERRVFIHGLKLDMLIGIYPDERVRPQPVGISLDLTVHDDVDVSDVNDPARIVCYDTIATRVRELCAKRHVGLVETLAERIAELCLEDHRVRSVRVKVEKPEALPDCQSVGIEIERQQRA